MSSRRSAAAFSLVEVLIVLAILSGSLLAVFFLIQATTRSGGFNKQQLLAWQLMSNMFERYRLFPFEKLASMFSSGAGARIIEEDPILNSAAAMTSETVKKLGFQRDAFFKKVSGRKSHGVLHLVVSWTGADGKVHSVGQDLLATTPEEPRPEAAAAAEGGGELQERHVSLASADRSGERGGGGEHPLVRQLKQKDMLDGQLNLPWVPTPADTPLSDVVEQVSGILKTQSIPDGTYPFEWERIGIEDAGTHGTLGEAASLAILTLRSADATVFLLLREDYGAKAAAGLPMRMLDSEPLASRGDRRVLKSPPPASGAAAPLGSRAHVDVTPTRVLIYRLQADGAGAEIPFSQTLQLTTLEGDFIEALKNSTSWSSRGVGKLDGQVARIVESAGLDATELPVVPESRERLGW